MKYIISLIVFLCLSVNAAPAPNWKAVFVNTKNATFYLDFNSLKSDGKAAAMRLRLVDNDNKAAFADAVVIEKECALGAGVLTMYRVNSNEILGTDTYVFGGGNGISSIAKHICNNINQGD